MKEAKDKLLNTNPNSLCEILKNHTVYVQTHNFPDPDALASAFGLQEFLKAHGIESRLCYDGNIDKLSTKRMLTNFDMAVIHSKYLPDMKETDYIVIIDGQKFNSNFTDLPGAEVACIDHHPTVRAVEYKYKDVRMVGACSSIVVSYYKETNTPISKKAATALCYGIKMDTMDFTRGTTSFDTEMFAWAFERADASMLSGMYKNVMEFHDLRAYAAAIENIKIYERTGFAVIPFDCPDALIAIISDFILSLDVVDVSVVYSIRRDGLKFSVRSEVNHVNAGEIVQKALEGYGDGGGHKTMAGGYVPNSGKEKMGEHYQDVISEIFLKVLDQ